MGEVRHANLGPSSVCATHQDTLPACHKGCLLIGLFGGEGVSMKPPRPWVLAFIPKGSVQLCCRVRLVMLLTVVTGYIFVRRRVCGDFREGRPVHTATRAKTT